MVGLSTGWAVNHAATHTRKNLCLFGDCLQSFISGRIQLSLLPLFVEVTNDCVLRRMPFFTSKLQVVFTPARFERATSRKVTREVITGLRSQVAHRVESKADERRMDGRGHRPTQEASSIPARAFHDPRYEVGMKSEYNSKTSRCRLSPTNKYSRFGNV